jgi:uroporphyrinogen-III synthase
VRRRVLITRDPERASDLLQALAAADIDAMAVPVTFSRRVADVFPVQDWSAIDTVVFTSANAVRYFAEILRENGRELPPFVRLACIGEATMEAVRHEWRAPDIVTDGTGSATLVKALQVESPHSVLWPCAREALPDLGDALEKAHVSFRRWPVYFTEQVPADELRSRLGNQSDYSAVVFAAPSAVRSLLKAWPGAWAFTAVAIGQTTAKAISRLTSVRCITSRSPLASDLAEAVKSALQNVEPVSAESTPQGN